MGGRTSAGVAGAGWAGPSAKPNVEGDSRAARHEGGFSYSGCTPGAVDALQRVHEGKESNGPAQRGVPGGNCLPGAFHHAGGDAGLQMGYSWSQVRDAEYARGNTAQNLPVNRFSSEAGNPSPVIGLINRSDAHLYSRGSEMEPRGGMLEPGPEGTCVESPVDEQVRDGMQLGFQQSLSTGGTFLAKQLMPFSRLADKTKAAPPAAASDICRSAEMPGYGEAENTDGTEHGLLPDNGQPRCYAASTSESNARDAEPVRSQGGILAGHGLSFDEQDTCGVAARQLADWKSEGTPLHQAAGGGKEHGAPGDDKLGANLGSLTPSTPGVKALPKPTSEIEEQLPKSQGDRAALSSHSWQESSASRAREQHSSKRGGLGSLQQAASSSSWEVIGPQGVMKGAQPGRPREMPSDTPLPSLPLASEPQHPAFRPGVAQEAPTMSAAVGVSQSLSDESKASGLNIRHIKGKEQPSNSGFLSTSPKAKTSPKGHHLIADKIAREGTAQQCQDLANKTASSHLKLPEEARHDKPGLKVPSAPIGPGEALVSRDSASYSTAPASKDSASTARRQIHQQVLSATAGRVQRLFLQETDSDSDSCSDSDPATSPAAERFASGDAGDEERGALRLLSPGIGCGPGDGCPDAFCQTGHPPSTDTTERMQPDTTDIAPGDVPFSSAVGDSCRDLCGSEEPEVASKSSSPDRTVGHNQPLRQSQASVLETAALPVAQGAAAGGTHWGREDATLASDPAAALSVRNKKYPAGRTSKLVVDGQDSSLQGASHSCSGSIDDVERSPAERGERSMALEPFSNKAPGATTFNSASSAPRDGSQSTVGAVSPAPPGSFSNNAEARKDDATVTWPRVGAEGKEAGCSSPAKSRGRGAPEDLHSEPEDLPAASGMSPGEHITSPWQVSRHRGSQSGQRQAGMPGLSSKELHASPAASETKEHGVSTPDSIQRGLDLEGMGPQSLSPIVFEASPAVLSMSAMKGHCNKATRRNGLEAGDQDRPQPAACHVVPTPRPAGDHLALGPSPDCGSNPHYLGSPMVPEDLHGTGGTQRALESELNTVGNPPAAVHGTGRSSPTWIDMDPLTALQASELGPSADEVLGTTRASLEVHLRGSYHAEAVPAHGSSKPVSHGLPLPDGSTKVDFVPNPAFLLSKDVDARDHRVGKAAAPKVSPEAMHALAFQPRWPPAAAPSSSTVSRDDATEPETVYPRSSSGASSPRSTEGSSFGGTAEDAEGAASEGRLVSLEPGMHPQTGSSSPDPTAAIFGISDIQEGPLMPSGNLQASLGAGLAGVNHLPSDGHGAPFQPDLLGHQEPGQDPKGPIGQSCKEVSLAPPVQQQTGPMATASEGPPAAKAHSGDSSDMQRIAHRITQGEISEALARLRPSRALGVSDLGATAEAAKTVSEPLPAWAQKRQKELQLQMEQLLREVSEDTGVLPGKNLQGHPPDENSVPAASLAACIQGQQKLLPPEQQGAPAPGHEPPRGLRDSGAEGQPSSSSSVPAEAQVGQESTEGARSQPRRRAAATLASLRTLGVKVPDRSSTTAAANPSGRPSSRPGGLSKGAGSRNGADDADGQNHGTPEQEATELLHGRSERRIRGTTPDSGHEGMHRVSSLMLQPTEGQPWAPKAPVPAESPASMRTSPESGGEPCEEHLPASLVPPLGLTGHLPQVPAPLFTPAQVRANPSTPGQRHASQALTSLNQLLARIQSQTRARTAGVSPQVGSRAGAVTVLAFLWPDHSMPLVHCPGSFTVVT